MAQNSKSSLSAKPAAAKLLYLSQPAKSSPTTTPVAASMGGPRGWAQRYSYALVRRILQRMQYGQLEVRYPDGHSEYFGQAVTSESQPLPSRALIELRNYSLFSKIVRSGSIGFGESYVDGDWQTPDLAAVLILLLNNARQLEERLFNKNIVLRFAELVAHWLRRNSLTGSKRNIAAHYDLSNQLFKLFLDPSLTYSSGIFAKPDDSLERAQQRKVAAILEKARISPGHSVLEIGSGWGTLALQAAEQHACRVKSISLSQEQLALARERAQQRGLSKLVDFEYCDYRQVTGSFDSIVSVEMMEAVGKEYLPVFFKHCDRLLKPDGTVVLQVIAFPEAFYSDYLRRQDFIQKHIFPGSHLPTLAAMLEAVSRSADFVVEHIENIGPHYAPTLAEWRRRFEAKQMEVQALGFDQRFSRLWNFYLASCEAQFSTRWLQVYQIVLMRPNNQREILRFAQREQPEASKEIVGMKRAS